MNDKNENKTQRTKDSREHSKNYRNRRKQTSLKSKVLILVLFILVALFGQNALQHTGFKQLSTAVGDEFYTQYVTEEDFNKTFYGSQ